jgi:hypothetical protein
MGNVLQVNSQALLPTRARFLVSLHLILMARRIVSWGGSEHIVSVDSIIQDKPDTSPTVLGTPHVVHSRTTNMASQVMGPSRTRTWMSTNTYPGADAADDSFVRHPKYFFKDGNVAFLVRVVRPCK